jgi:hypothetical protein
MLPSCPQAEAGTPALETHQLPWFGSIEGFALVPPEGSLVANDDPSAIIVLTGGPPFPHQPTASLTVSFPMLSGQLRAHELSRPFATVCLQTISSNCERASSCQCWC